MISSLCLTFVASSVVAPAVPVQVRQLAQSRLREQFHANHPDMQLSFDDADCTNRGQYTYTNDSLRLSAEHALWPGTREYGLSDLIEGRKIDFPLMDAPRSPDWAQKGAERTTSSTPLSRFLTGALAGGALGAAGGTVMSPNKPSQGLNALVFGLSGAAAGGLIALAWHEIIK